MNILKYKLYEFIAISENARIDFAKKSNDCIGSGNHFIDVTVEYDLNETPVRSYKFKEFYLGENDQGIYSYYVLAIPGKSYLMYEEEESSNIFIWVAYTEEKFRGKGYITQLLKELKHQNPEKIITTDTYNEN